MEIDLRRKDFYYTPKPGSGTKKTFPLHVRDIFNNFFQRIHKVKVDKSYSKSGRVAVIYSKKRLVFLKFENQLEMDGFLRLMNAIIHNFDDKPLYVPGMFFWLIVFRGR